MPVRISRRNVAGLLAAIGLLGSPGRTQAEITVLIEEVDLTGSVVFFGPVSFTGSNLPSQSNPFSTPNFIDIQVTVSTTSGTISNVNSLTTAVNMRPAASFDPTHQLRLIVTDNGFRTPSAGGNAAVTNNAGASSGIVGGVNQLTNQTQLLTTAGEPVGDPTDPATAVGGVGGSSATTTATVPNVPGDYAIQQTIYVRAVRDPTGEGIDPNSTLGGSASSTVITSAAGVIPAPGGLVLLAAGLPALGLRRWLRKRSPAR
jgi:hypothetical protein